MSLIFLGRKVPCWKRTVAVAIYDFSTSVLRSSTVSSLKPFTKGIDTTWSKSISRLPLFVVDFLLVNHLACFFCLTYTFLEGNINDIS